MKGNRFMVVLLSSRTGEGRLLMQDNGNGVLVVGMMVVIVVTEKYCTGADLQVNGYKY
jgi:hypothetical protein